MNANRPKRSLFDVLIAQWPGMIGFALVAGGLLSIRATVQFDHRVYRASILTIAAGIAFIGYWALANRSDSYNF